MVSVTSSSRRLTAFLYLFAVLAGLVAAPPDAQAQVRRQPSPGNRPSLSGGSAPGARAPLPNIAPTRRVPLVGEAGQRIPYDVPIRSLEGVPGFEQVANQQRTSRAFIGGPGGANVLEQVVNMTQNGGDDIQPYWSTDEQFIYFVSNRTGSYQIYRIRANEGLNPGSGGTPPPGAGPPPVAEQLTNDPNSDFAFPVLNANATQIAFIRATAGGPRHLWIAPLPANGQINLTTPGVATNLTQGRTPAGAPAEFAEVQRAAYLNVTTIVFSGRLANDPAGRFHIWQVDIGSGVFFRLTDGNASELNPAVAPAALGSPDLGLVAFDSDATSYGPGGRPNSPASATATTGGERNIFVLAQNGPAIAAPVRMTNPGGSGISNIEPSWASTRTNPQSNPQGRNVYLAWASTRQDVRGNTGDPTQITGFTNGTTHDIYYLNAYDPVSSTLRTEAAPGTPLTASTGYANKLDAADPQYQFDDRNPSWAQFITILRISHQSDRAGTYRKLGVPDPIGSGFTKTPGVNDIFISTVVDITAPTLLRWDTTRQDGDIVHINLGTSYNRDQTVRTPRDGVVPSQPLFFTVRVEDRESGMHPERVANDDNQRGAVFLLFKNPNSSYQQSQGGQEHKEWSGVGLIGALTSSSGGTSFVTPYFINYTANIAHGFEYEAQGLGIGTPPLAGTGVYHNHLLTGGTRLPGDPAPLLPVASVHDAGAFSGRNNPPMDGGTYSVVLGNGQIGSVQTQNVYLRLDRLPDNLQDNQGGVLYGATASFPEASDWFIDVIAYDNAVNPYDQRFRYNWIIYDNVWGFSTASFSGANNILVVADYALGQKFFNTRFSTRIAPRVTDNNLLNLNFGAESYYTDASIGRLPTIGAPSDLAATPATPRLYNQSAPFTVTPNGITGAAFGVWGGFGVPHTLGVNSYTDEYSDDGTRVAGRPYPPTGRYDIWRTLARGPVLLSVLGAYLPQPAQGTPPDLRVGETTNRSARVANRMVVWASPLSGNLFVGRGTITDPETQINLTNFVNAGGRLFISGQDIAWALTLNGARQNAFLSNILKAQFVADGVGVNQRDITATVIADPNTTDAVPGPNNDIATEPWTSPAHHAYGRFNGTIWVYDPPSAGPVSIYNFFSVLDTANARRDASPLGVSAPDFVQPVPGTYTGPGNAYTQWIYTGRPDAGILSSDFPGSGGRVAYASYGFESTNYEWYDSNSIIYTLGRRAEIMHNIVCSFRTGTIVGRVTNASQGSAPIPNVLIRVVPLYGPNGSRQDLPAAYTGVSNQDGTFQVVGVEADAYVVTAYLRGFSVQRSATTTVHGGDTRTQVDLALVEVPPGNIAGRVLRGDRQTGIPGIQVQARALRADGSFDVFRAVTGLQGDYTIAGVPVGFYTLVANAPGVRDLNGDGQVDDAELADPANQVDVNGDGVVNRADVADPRNNINYNPALATVTAADPAQVDIDAPGVTFQNGQIEVRSGETTRVDFILRAPPQDVTGRVIDSATGSPIPGANVTATQPNASGQPIQVGSAVTDANGVYTITAVPEGNTTITAVALGYSPNTITILVGGVGTITAPDIALVKLPPGAVRGLVSLGTSNKPEAGATVRLFAIRNGVVDTTATFTTTTTGTVATSAKGNPYNYEFTGVAPGDYQITVEKAGLSADPVATTITVVSNDSTEPINFRLLPPHIYGAGVQLISVPLDYSGLDPRQIFGLSPTSDNNNDGVVNATDVEVYNVFKVADWTGSEYNIAPATPGGPIFPLVVGKGYFVRFGAPAPVVAPGRPVAERTFTINVPAGWSLIGHPFYNEQNPALTPEVDITSVTVAEPGGPARTMTDAVNAGLVRGVVFEYTGSLQGSQYIQTTVMRPWLGYWFRAFKPVTLTFTYPGRSVPSRFAGQKTITRADLERTVTRSITSRTVTDWRLQIAARQGSLLDTDNSIGVAPGAKDGFDQQYDTEKPPMMTQADSLYMALEGTHPDGRSVALTDDIRSAGSGTETYEFTVRSNGAEQGEVTLYWPNVSRLPRGLDPVLVDLATGRRVVMRSSSSYRFAPGDGGRAVHRFRVEVKPPVSTPLQILNLKSSGSRSGGYRFTFTATREVNVIAQLQTLAGRTVRQIATRSRAMEESAIHWDGRDQSGATLPAGPYVLSLSAKDGDGRAVQSRVMIMNIR